MLKHFNISKNRLALAALMFILFGMLLTTNCGKRKAPLPPVETVQQRINISGKQFGNKISIFWVMPIRNASTSNILNIDRVDLYRIIEPENTPLTLSEEDFANKSILIASIPITDADFNKKTLTYVDELKFSGQSIRLRYALRFVNSSGQKAAFSNFLIIEPSVKSAEAPKSLKSEITERAINLTWTAPQQNIDGSTPANILGYNIYRVTNKPENTQKLNQTPVSETQFSDKTFEFEREYAYFVRAVSLGKDGEPVESLESNTISILPRDTFPPAAPTAFTIAAAPNVLSIFFAVNLENDISGYRIYRSTDVKQPKSDWLLLTNEILQTNTFQDKSIESGKLYYYYLTAVDKAGNESRPSEIISESAP